MFAENTDYEIMTPTGWQDFRGVLCSGKKPTLNIKLDDGNEVNATAQHNFFVSGVKTKAGDLTVGDCIETTTNPVKVNAISVNEPTIVYDIVEVADKNHHFIANNTIKTKNCDELAFVRPSIATLFWTSITPTLATGGKAIVTSTPNSDEDQFAQIWKQANKCVDSYGNPTELGVNGFKAYSAKWSDHPERDQKWADEMQATLGEEKFRREICCEFIVSEETLISSMLLPTLTGIDPIEKQGQVRWYKKPKRGCTYAVALDPSLGTGGDNAAIQILELPTLTQVAEWQHNKTPIQQQVKLLRELTQYIYDCIGTTNDIYYSLENNSLGEAALVAIAELGEENICGTFLSDTTAQAGGKKRRKGFTVTNRSKLVACAKFKQLVESKKLTVNSKNLISELKNFIASGGSYAAKIGETDDLVMSMLLAVRMTQALQNYSVELDSVMRGNEEFDIMPMPFILI
ncbi:large terminase protein [uncultured Caudovirales phage]|uniref:Large terminase protein n=1 Tax=uncultured Caudovirales phage TaxID=2100421 RepID=A0A6J5L813_9CAUD|nr:large terminase protein [uncultured Caudovirales phage]